VKYSEAQISRLEQNQRLPELSVLAALFIPALYIDDEPETVARLMELAALARGETLASGKTIVLSHSDQPQIRESVRIEEDDESNNLPLHLTSFIGREPEIEKIERLLKDKTVRLITLTGSGGSGKTRLALETARQLLHEYRDGIWLVELASISNAVHIPQTFIAALGITKPPKLSPTSAITKFLRSKQSLLVVDNCEHVLQEAAKLIEEILLRSPGIQVIVTSREILNISGEIRFQVPPLSTPEPGSKEAQLDSPAEALLLFAERARAVHPAFRLEHENWTAVLQVCRQLDGMPLAIELAAARTNILSVQQIADRLKRNIQLLTGGSQRLLHHKSLQATMEWSYDLLSEKERVLFRRLSVFAGGWTLEAAQSVASDGGLVPEGAVVDLISGLVNKSLTVVDWQHQAETRYTMLQTIHVFAKDKLQASGETEAISARHFDYFFSKAQQAEPKLFAAESSVDWAEREIDNLRAALNWGLETDNNRTLSQERAGRALDLMTHIWPLWLSRGYAIEGYEWLDQLLAVHTAPTPARARALLLAGDFAGLRGDGLGKMTLIQEALALAQGLGDKKRIAWALMEMGLVERERQSPEATEFLTESLELFQGLNDALWVCRTSFLLAETFMQRGDMQAARRYWNQGLNLCRTGNDRWQMGWGLHGLGDLERLEGHLEQALQLYRESLELKVSVRDKLGIIYSLTSFAQLAATQGQFRRAAMLWGAVEKLGETLNFSPLGNSSDQLYTSLIPGTRARLGETAFHSAWAEGRALNMPQAIEYALNEA
jgi:non-specific serine/threonine protein kinase